MKWMVWLIVTLLPLAAVAEEAVEPVPVDERVGSQLDALDLAYDVDKDNDYELLFEFDDGRSQFAWIRSQVYASHDVDIRDIWSYAYMHPTKHLPGDLERRLLIENYGTVMGSWAREENAIVYIAKIPADAPAEVLQAALYEVAEIADELEKELVGTDEL
jgi:hypothetical protein